MNDEALKHGVSVAGYTMSPAAGRHVPFIECACGNVLPGSSWEEAGRNYDGHLRDVKSVAKESSE